MLPTKSLQTAQFSPQVSPPWRRTSRTWRTTPNGSPRSLFAFAGNKGVAPKLDDVDRLEAAHRSIVASMSRPVIGSWPRAGQVRLSWLAAAAVHELEYSGGDFATMSVLARRANPVGSLSAETRGDLARSPRWDEVLRPVGIGDEAVVACRDALGCWGWIKAYRDSDDASFAEHDVELLAQVGPTLGSALRRRLDAAQHDSVAAPSSPGVVVLDRDLRAVSWTAGARQWIDALPLARLWAAWGILPAVVYPVAAMARSRNGPSEAHALERAADGAG
jgi:hypothetical protein